MWSYAKLTIWGIMWLILWVSTTIIRKNKENCLTWAIRKWDTEGGYLVIRWCRHNKLRWIRWPHFLWLAEEHEQYLEHVIPPKDSYDEYHTIPSPWFTPRHVKGDKKSVKEN